MLPPGVRALAGCAGAAVMLADRRGVMLLLPAAAAPRGDGAPRARSAERARCGRCGDAEARGAGAER